MIIKLLTVALALAFSTIALAQPYVIHSFRGEVHGSLPVNGVVSDSAGNLYGETQNGGNNSSTKCLDGPGCGTIFKLTPNGSGDYTFSNLYLFRGGALSDPTADGDFPAGGLTLDTAGNLYGTTEHGGATGSGCVFELSPPVAGGLWTEKILYSFTGDSVNSTDAQRPSGGVIFDTAGNLYGTAFSRSLNKGVVFELTPNSGGGWTETIPDILGDNTASLGGRLIFDNAGNLYGVGCDPSTGANCVALELSPSSGGAWTETVLVTLPTDADFGKPVPNLIFDTAGNLYGVSGAGGGVGAGPGTVFKLTHSTTGWTGEVIHHFIGSDGFDPTAITLDSAGNLFGVTGFGGPSNWGVAFKLTPTAGGWVESKVHEFSGNADGAFPDGIIVGVDGNLYGTTYWGGSATGEAGLGVVFELKP